MTELYCAVCSNAIKTPYECENECNRVYCSENCAQHSAIEDDAVGYCPGVYWCRLCREEYLTFAKGHNWLMGWHDPSPELGMFVSSEFETTGLYLPQCSKCGMWGYEFKSYNIDVLGSYEGQACGSKIRVYNED